MNAVIDRIVQFPNRYKLVNVADDTELGVFDFEPETGTVVRVGTEIDAALFQSIADDLAKRVLLNGGELKDTIVTFSDTESRDNIASGEKTSTLFAKIKKWFGRLKALAFKSKTEAGDYTAGSIANADISESAGIAQSKIDGLQDNFDKNLYNEGVSDTFTANGSIIGTVQRKTGYFIIKSENITNIITSTPTGTTSCVTDITLSGKYPFIEKSEGGERGVASNGFLVWQLGINYISNNSIDIYGGLVRIRKDGLDLDGYRNLCPIYVQYTLPAEYQYNEPVIDGQPIRPANQEEEFYWHEEWEKGLNLAFTKVIPPRATTIVAKNLPAGTYTISINPVGDTSATYEIIGEGLTNTYGSGENSRTFTTTIEGDISVYYNGDLTSSSVMLAKGTHPYPYVPYYGGIVRQIGGEFTGPLSLPSINSVYKEGFLPSSIVPIPIVDWNVIDPTHTTDTYLKNLLKWVCSAYPNKQHHIFIGTQRPNANGQLYLHIYNTNDKNAEGLPQYATGFFQNFGGTIVLFGTNAYTYYYRSVIDENGGRIYGTLKANSFLDENGDIRSSIFENENGTIYRLVLKLDIGEYGYTYGETVVSKNIVGNLDDITAQKIIDIFKNKVVYLRGLKGYYGSGTIYPAELEKVVFPQNINVSIKSAGSEYSTAEITSDSEINCHVKRIDRNNNFTVEQINKRTHANFKVFVELTKQHSGSIHV